MFWKCRSTTLQYTQLVNVSLHQPFTSLTRLLCKVVTDERKHTGTAQEWFVAKREIPSI